MTPPLLTAQPARIHRRAVPPTPVEAHVRQAERHRAALAAHEPVVVEVAGHGRGWYVEHVCADGTYRLWRDGAALVAAWTDVPLGQ
ncbi:hypothetical protein AB0B63_07210 [Micromonospora sp. NPDC049081]|uniref:hypothetical protein n=1 Tax=Micromonospora sp. NPDC049081 TaxID=3155150 RepID=UPI0033C2E321